MLSCWFMEYSEFALPSATIAHSSILLQKKMTEATDDVKPEISSTQTQQIALKVVSQDGVEVFFKIKRSTHLKKLMDAYSKRQGLSPASVRFVFDGDRLNGNETPDSLEMADQDTIDVLVEQTGGLRSLLTF